MKIAVVISPNWRDYADKYLSDCLVGLRQQTWSDFDLFLLDNGSSEASRHKILTIVKDVWPEAVKRLNLLYSSENLGFAGGNNLALTRIVADAYDYAALFNMDGHPAADCLERLIEAAESCRQATAVQARIMLWPDRHLVNSLGNQTHFLGFGFCSGYKKQWSDEWLSDYDGRPIAYPSGAAVLLRVADLEKIGLFDEEYWMYNEDQDLGWRCWLSGHQVILSARAVFYHCYEFNRSSAKFYWLDRNRWLSMLRNYQLKTLLLLLPLAIVVEFGMLPLAVLHGWGREKIKVWAYLCRPATWRYVIRARCVVAQLRQLPDSRLVTDFAATIQDQEVDHWILRLANAVLSVYWRLVKRLI